MMRQIVTWGFFAIICAGSRAAEPEVIVYPFAKGLPQSDAYRLTVAGREVFVHKAEVADFACFAIRGKVDVMVECAGPVKNAVLRPRARGILPRCEGKTVRFTADGPGPLTLEVNGKIKPALHLFIDPPEEDAPAPGAAGVRRFAGGQVHEAGEITLHSNETLYLEPGAVVRGTVRAKGAKNIRILGRGFFDARERTVKTQFVRLDDCAGVVMRDVGVIGAFGWTLVPWHSRDVALRNVKIFSWRDNDDGLDVCASRNVVVDRCFFRTKDDCIAVKSLGGDRTGEQDVANVVVKDSVFWNAEWGNALEIGFELRTAKVRSIVWRNCDIIRVQGGAVCSIHNGDFATVEDVVFDNIRVEDANDLLVDLRVGLSIYSADCPEPYSRRNAKRKGTGAGPWVPFGLLSADERAVSEKQRGAIRNVVFKNIQLLDKVPPRSEIINWGGKIEDVVFDGIRVGEKAIGKAEELNLKVEGAEGVLFNK